MKRNYDIVAPYYDTLSRLVFGNAISNANAYLAKSVPANSRILIIGGGTGCILQQISEVHLSGLEITYVEISKKMIEQARTKITAGNKIIFINQAIQDADLNQSFDVIITPFFFDNFSKSNAMDIFRKLHELLRLDGLWLFADFKLQENQLFWQKPLLNLMYSFFKIVCQVEASSLPDMEEQYRKYNYKIISASVFYKQFICSTIYQKQ